MAKKKYIKDSKGTTVSVTTDTLGLEKPLLNENYDIDVHNRNMDKIDEDLTPIDDSYIIELFQHDGDTSRPRDYYTKEESDLKYATKEEVENIDLSNLATKEEANNALNKANEALQVGSNVKQRLVDKLTSEGLDVSTNNTFEELISGIALGKKWASGSLSTNSITSFPYKVTTNLDFIPSFVFLKAGSCSVFNQSAGMHSFSNPIICNLCNTGETSMYSINSISKTSFSITGATTWSSYPPSLGGGFSWYAFE